MLKYNEELSAMFEQFSQNAAQSCGCGLTARDIAVAKLAVSLKMNHEALITDAVINAKQQQLSNSDIGKVAALVLERQGKALHALVEPLAEESCCPPAQNDGCCS